MTTHIASSDKLPLFWQALNTALKRIRKGSLKITHNGHTAVYGSGDDIQLNAEVTIHDQVVFQQIATGGTLAAAECYMLGLWDSPDLTKVIRIFAANIEEDLDRTGGLKRARSLVLKVAHWLNRNSIKGSKKNIRAHYDLGNDLFESFLDPTMMYSSAIFAHDQMSLHDAQLYRLNRICEKLHLGPSNHLLEIGTGWGSLAIHAAKHFGCKVTTTTISDEQYQYVKEKIQQEGLADRIQLLNQDYRLLTGNYDRLVSIEMIEAVGEKYLSGYFNKIDELLNEEGIALLQSITMPDQRYASYLNNVDFIQKYIFPGGHLPSVSRIHQLIAERTSMTVAHFEDITRHYATTLHHWHKQFVSNYMTLPKQQYDDVFYRMWRYYLAYCEGGFRENAINTSQIVFKKPGVSRDWVIR